MTIVIDELKHRTGSHSKYMTGEGLTQLRNREGYCCCLGFATRQAGGTCGRVGTPQDVERGIQKLIEAGLVVRKAIFYINSKFSDDAININDNPLTTYEEKKALLAECAKKHGHEFIFVKGQKAYREALKKLEENRK